MSVNSERNAAPVPFLRLRLSSLLALAFLGLTAIALAYVGGVMTGRASLSAERRLAAAAGRAAPKPALPAQSASRGGGEPDAQAILSPEELSYARALRKADGAPETAVPAAKPVAPPLPPAKEAAQSPASSGQSPGQGGPALTVGGAPPAGAAGAQGKPVLAPTASPMQDYVFQMGAFKDEESVDSLRQRLEGRGLRTRMQRDGKLYVVLVLLRGDESRAGEVSQIAEELRLGKPMLRSRKPVQQP